MDRYNKNVDLTIKFEKMDTVLQSMKSQIDEFLADLIIPLHAFKFYLSNFEYLLIDSSELISEEIKLLERENNIGPLQKEIGHLRQDFSLIDNLPDSVHFGPFIVDIAQFKKTTKDSIESCIMKAFSETVENKFKDLLELNSAKTKELKRRLVQNAANIDQYI